ncbi:ferredoxin [Arthrobacter sp. D1-29]
MKVVINEHKCVAAGQCASYAQDVFDQRDEDGIVVLLNENPPESQHADTRRAAGACPAMAIVIEEGAQHD